MTREERKKMVGKMLEVAIKATFKNHVYLYRNPLFRQAKGGVIGLRLTGVVARIVMDRWSRQFRTALQEAKVKELMLEKYVKQSCVGVGYS